MDYRRLMDTMNQSGVFADQERADAAVKAVIGILASRMSEHDARELSSRLPEPLTYDKIRHRQGWQLGISFDQYRYEIAGQFHINTDQAQRVIGSVFHLLKEEIPGDTLHKWEQHLPVDWAEQMEQA